jgi:hypothetical protein
MRLARVNPSRYRNRHTKSGRAAIVSALSHGASHKTPKRSKCGHKTSVSVADDFYEALSPDGPGPARAPQAATRAAEPQAERTPIHSVTRVGITSERVPDRPFLTFRATCRNGERFVVLTQTAPDRHHSSCVALPSGGLIRTANSPPRAGRPSINPRRSSA